jgi:hypothetical protein
MLKRSTTAPTSTPSIAHGGGNDGGGNDGDGNDGGGNDGGGNARDGRAAHHHNNPRTRQARTVRS